nr:hypothetical protein GCM10020093_035160 [Planobispora longispora]
MPESVLLAVSYLESRWDRNGGLPSVSGGYGPMHLVDAGLVGTRPAAPESAARARPPDPVTGTAITTAAITETGRTRAATRHGRWPGRRPFPRPPPPRRRTPCGWRPG